MDCALDQMIKKDLKAYRDLLEAVRYVVTQQEDDVCWLDAYIKLAGLVGVVLDPKLLPREKFLNNCSRFYDSLACGYPYKTGEVYVSGGEGI